MTRGKWTAGGAGAAALIALFLAGALGAPWLTAYDPFSIVAAPLEGPSWAHPLGTDRVGRDVLTRVLHGARLSLGGSAAALAVIASIGVLLGALAGYYGRLLDMLLMRVVDAILAIPSLVLALAIAGVLRPGLLAVIVAVTAVWWARYARVTRALVLSHRERQFVEAARAAGAGDRRILRVHLLPHVLAPILALAAQEFGALILAVASLSFLGLGLQPPAPEWGTMINDAKSVFLVAPHVLLAPGLAVTLAVLAFNVAGEQISALLAPGVPQARRPIAAEGREAAGRGRW